MYLVHFVCMRPSYRLVSAAHVAHLIHANAEILARLHARRSSRLQPTSLSFVRTNLDACSCDRTYLLHYVDYVCVRMYVCLYVSPILSPAFECSYVCLDCPSLHRSCHSSFCQAPLTIVDVKFRSRCTSRPVFSWLSPSLLPVLPSLWRRLAY